MRAVVLLTVVVALVIACTQAYALPVAGTTSGTFQNPVGEAYPVLSGAGTNHFAFGSGSPPSSLTFTGTTFSASTEEVFNLGTLDYYNGTIAMNSGATAVDLGIQLAFTLPTGVSKTFLYNLQLVTTQNYGVDPWADADYVYLPTLFTPQTFSYEGTDYTVELAGFYDPSGNGQTQINQFHVLENNSASATLKGKVTSNLHPDVPEPISVMLGVLGLGSVAGFRRLRRK